MSENILIPYRTVGRAFGDVRQELGKLLAKFRKSAKLSQAELAERMGLSKKRGYCHISHLETGREKKPSLYTILLYLKACRVPWTTFFQKLSEIDFKIEHKKVMRQVDPAPFDKKSKDTTTSCECDITQPDKRGGAKTPYQKLDMERVRTKIDNKVKILLHSYQINEEQKTPYFKFADELFANYDSGQIPAIFERYWQEKVLRRGIINEIKSIIYKTFRYEQKRLEKQKALPSEKNEYETTDYTDYTDYKEERESVQSVKSVV